MYWNTLADKYRGDAAYRAAIDTLVDYGDKMASAIKATALANPAGCNPKDTFWGRLAEKYRKNAVYRAAIDAQAAQGCKEACSVRATAA